MTNKPILFSPEMVKAIIDGKKTQTRRIMKVQPPDDSFVFSTIIDSTSSETRKHVGKHRFIKLDGAKLVDQTKPFNNPFGEVGGLLWVRETFGHVSFEIDSNENMIDWKPNRPAIKLKKEIKIGSGWLDGHIIFAADGQFHWLDENFQEQISCWRPSIHMPKECSRLTLKIKNIRVERMQDGGDREFWGDKWHQNPWVWVCEFEIESLKK